MMMMMMSGQPSDASLRNDHPTFVRQMSTRLGAIFKCIVYILVALNIKSWPLAWHTRFYYLLFKHMVWKRKQKPKSLFKPNCWTTHTPLMEMDMNLHKSNSTYFSDLDIARSDLLLALFKDFFIHYRFEKGDWPFVPLGSVLTVFKKEIMIYKPYSIKSRVLGWDKKWLFVLSRFEVDGKLAAVALSKYVFKHKRRTISPEEALQLSGLDSDQNLEQGRIDFEKAKGMLDVEAVEHESM